MADKEEIRRQNCADLVYLVTILANIIEKKPLTVEEEIQLQYGEKILKTVINKEREIQQ